MNVSALGLIGGAVALVIAAIIVRVMIPAVKERGRVIGMLLSMAGAWVLAVLLLRYAL